MPTNAGISAGTVPGWNSDFTAFTPYYQPVPKPPSSSTDVIERGTTTGVPYSFVGGVVPNAAALEAQSSTDIGQLLNPGTSFPDVNRQSAELAAVRGIPGSAAAYGTGLRMTDEERLKRIALGENLLSGAYARNQPNIITPYQQSQIDIQRGYLDLARQRGQISQAEYNNQLQRLNQPTVTYSGTPGVGASGIGSFATGGGGYPAPVAYPGTGPQTEIQDTRGVYPNPLAPMLPLYPGEGSSFDFGNPPAPNYEGGTYASPVPYNPAIDTYNYGGDAEAGGGMGAYEGAGGLDNLINDYLNSGGYE